MANKELKIKISSAQNDRLEEFNFLDNTAKLIPKVKPKETKVDYKPVVRDYIKVDRYVIDLVLPFLNSKCSAGVSVLYLDLYRMTYGYGKNKLSITDELIEKRIAIPKRTIMEYRKKLEKYDLITYIKGHRTKRGQFTIKRPEQSVYFKDYIHNSVSQPPKNVSSTEGKPTLYNIDNLYIDSKTLVENFYIDAGYKKNSITRDMLNNGIKQIHKLIEQGHKIDFIKELCSWSIQYCKENNKEIYGIGFINYLLPQYITRLETKQKKKVKMAAEMKKAKERDAELEKERNLLTKYNMLPKHLQSGIMVRAKKMVDDELENHSNPIINSYIEKMLIDGFIVEIMETEYSEG
tara:strand:- start:674 stop:1720 length:1047 start_codon:yes stop_codon:yes gene_type:complete